MTGQSRELRVRPIDRPPVLAEDPVARMVRQAAEQGVELEVTFRAKAMTSTNAGRQPLQATYLGSREQMSQAALELYQRQLALVKRNPRQGIVPQRRTRTTVAIVAALLVGAVVSAIPVIALVRFVASTVATVSGRAIAVGLVAAVLVASSGTAVVKHCPGAFHR